MSPKATAIDHVVLDIRGVEASAAWYVAGLVELASHAVERG